MATSYMGYDYDADGASLAVGQVVTVIQAEAGGWALVKTADGEGPEGRHMERAD
eukprot:m.409816 g.409816  ORF g.409816 m.409816 type:complete len:54 (-) comp28459_c1_seq3:2767-2928(-)